MVSLLALVLSACGGGDPALDADGLRSLLSAEDVRAVAAGPVRAGEVRDLLAQASAAGAEQVPDLDSWLGLTFTGDDEALSLTLTVMDFADALFESPEAADLHFERITQETGLALMDDPIGEGSISQEVNAFAGGSVVTFIKGDKIVQLLSGIEPGGTRVLLGLDDLLKLARLVESRL